MKNQKQETRDKNQETRQKNWTEIPVETQDLASTTDRNHQYENATNCAYNGPELNIKKRAKLI
jgi:hypothetical protein